MWRQTSITICVFLLNVLPGQTLVVWGDENEGQSEEQSRLTGDVVDESGRPVAAAGVTLRPTNLQFGGGSGMPTMRWELIGRTKTDAQGRFTIASLPRNSAACVLNVYAKGRTPSRLVIAVDPSVRLYERRVVLTPSITVRGRVVDEQGRPVVEARLKRKTRTGADGRFTIENMPADPEVRLVVYKDGYARAIVTAPQAAAVSGDWTITLRRPVEYRLTGKASFTDGSPARRRKLVLSFQADGRPVQVARTTTDEDGKFTSSLPVHSQDEPKTGYAMLTDETDRLLWVTVVQPVAGDQSDFDIVFERRGCVRITVRPSSSLPPTVKFQIGLERRDPSGTGSSLHRQHQLPATGGEVNIEELSPGKYQGYVYTAGPVRLHWGREIRIGPDESNLEVPWEIDVPKISFGKVRGRVVEANGQTPLVSGRVWANPAGDTSLVNGRFEVAPVPAGPLSVEVTANDFAPARVNTVVVADQTADLGVIQMERVEDAAGWVTGHIVYDDGSPALGAMYMGDWFTHHPIDVDNGYRIQLLAGDNVIDFDLRGALAWPRKDGIEQRISGADHHYPILRLEPGGYYLQARVNVVAGQTVRRDVVLPRMAQRTVRIDWRGPSDAKPTVRVFTRWNGDQYMRGMDFVRMDGNSISLHSLPLGETTVAVFAKGFAAYERVPDNENDAVVVIDPGAVGTIRVVPRDADGQIVADVRCYARSDLIPKCSPMRSVLQAQHALSGRSVSTYRTYTANEYKDDGTVLLKGLHPGTYNVTARHGDQTFRHDGVTVVSRKIVAVDLPVDQPVDRPLTAEMK